MCGYGDSGLAYCPVREGDVETEVVAGFTRNVHLARCHFKGNPFLCADLWRQVDKSYEMAIGMKQWYYLQDKGAYAAV